MIKNRFYSATFGVAAEALIAQALDTSAGAIAGSPASGTASVAVAANTTDQDQLVITVGQHTYEFTSAGAQTAAAYGTALLAYLNAEPYSVANGIVWTKSGTTSLVLTATFPNGSQYNGIPINIEAGPVNAGPSFSTFSSTAVAGGTNAIGGTQSTYKLFVANAAAGAVAAYWNDTNNALQPGDTTSTSNVGRKFFYAWKQADGTAMRTAPIPVMPSYKQVAYNAGVADVWAISFGGTYTIGQWLHVRLLDTTSKTVPYPNYEYQEKITVDLATTLGKLVTDINAELSANDPIATASTSGTTLTLTAKDKTRTIRVIAYVEVGYSTSNNVDQSTITYSQTAKAIAPLGTFADVKEFEKVYLVKNGAILYPGDHTLNVNVSDFQTQASNVVSNINYGYLIVSALKTERPQSAVHGFSHKAYVVVAAPAAAISYLASL